MATEAPRQYVPLTCHGHSRPVPHINFSSTFESENYFMISACKDGNPMLRQGQTGDWIGTFIGHKGAVWQAKLSPDMSNAATASADFSCKIWNSHTGEVLFTLKHEHIVRAIAYPPNTSDMVATGGFEKKLRLWDLQAASKKLAETTEEVAVESSEAHEIGAGTHTDPIKAIVWAPDPTKIITASGKTLRWFDVPTKSLVKTLVLDDEIKSCESSQLDPQFADSSDINGGSPVLAVAAGKTVVFFGGRQMNEELKRIKLTHGIASVALDLKQRKFAVGEEPGTWVRVYSYEDEKEIDVHKGHHGPVWSIAFSPDGKLYATASEDGTIKLWKNCEAFYGLWRGGANGTEKSSD
ncbi:serine-threonine kinase receptor-associated protein [Pyricularia oryzae 70-15]|uniref:Serine-threonine kinase receptor-associated protein n=3 Tax=Pyricularia oryzae TaxID=318829 RepID=G5EI73_PYRO7|nr:serine-threonine kinase receptor-associated protein [Pyricularia oryzae 70-15]ELQ40846.1 serine-threonine kinase receptor-associated protein [Pyricularia oryzae Y34]KAI7915959.1 serine-threonine kinase receptor-associated protein [Pyricularia oryzae]EAQ70734.1 hypothetical protein MGCH7_ch7g141 [Pyricularia oryzae 70-15]EHA46615.1 serine-threonine kinase receptor-associated protein [Pyricularia oryzae 70-15]KAI7918418.1 serine-threonine kinase receptor-associated protein [Pyricularia oryzae